MRFVPNSDRVLVKVDRQADERKVAGGMLYAPSTAAADGARVGTVVAVGPGKLNDATFVGIGRPPFSAGDRVVLDSVGGLEVEVSGEKLVLVRCEEILGKFVE